MKKRMFRVSVLSTILAVGCASTAIVDNTWRRQQPPAEPVPALRAPTPVRTVMDNGLTVLAVEKKTLPLVNVTVLIRAGASLDPSGRAGLAGFVGEMLKAGTKKRTAAQIAEEIETLGAHLAVGVDADSMTITATSLRDNFAAVFDVIADLVQHSVFAPAEMERVRRRQLGALAQAENEPSYTARRVFRRVVFGEHPYGHMVLGDAAAVRAISADDLLGFYRSHLRPAATAIIVVGDLSAADAGDAVARRFAGWTGAAGVVVPPADPAPQPTELVLVERPGAPQSQLRVGHLGVERSSPDYFALVMCNAILGGLFNSRINMNLREEKGYTYGARSAFDFLRGRGSFVVGTGVETSVTAPAVREIIKEVEAIRAHGVTEAELNNAKKRYSLSLSGYFQTVDAIAAMMANVFLHDLPLDYYQQLPDRIAAVQLTDVQAVAQKHLHPADLSVVVVGDPAQVEADLTQLGRGPVHRRGPGGEVLPVAPIGK